jgi:putative transposase
MAIEKELLDQLLAGRNPNEVFAKDGLLDDLKKALSERILNAELDEHLEDERAGGGINRRNGHSKKTVLTGTSKMQLAIPRDRAGSFDPKLIARYQRRFPDFDSKIVSMYARGMSVREIRGHLEELYGIDVSPDLISAVTDAVLEEVAEWQNRPLDAVYPLVFFDAIRVKIRDEGFVRNKAIYIALGILPDGTKEILGIWIEQTEGAKFWLRVMNELKNRGVADILIAVVDGLKPRGDRRRLSANNRPDLHRAPDPPFARVRVVEGSQSRRAGAQGNLPGRGRRSRHQGPGGLRDRRLGPTISSDHPELAAQLAAHRAILRLSGKRAPHHLHDKRNRGAELEAAPRRPHQGTLPQ